MNRNLIFTFCCSNCFFMSCTSKEEQCIQVAQTLAFDAAHVDTLLCKAIVKIDFVALELTEDSEIYGVNKMIIKNDLIFLGDFHSGKIIVYDMNGKVKFVLNNKGEGPQKYLELRSFTVGEHNIYILDNYRHAINVYDCHTGVFSQSRKLSFVAWDMELLDNDHFIFAYIPMEGVRLNVKQPSNKIFITNKNLEITRRYFNYKPDEYEFIGKS